MIQFPSSPLSISEQRNTIASIGNYQIRYLQCHIVTQYLVKHCLSNGTFISLHSTIIHGSGISIVHNNIKTFFQFAQSYFFFNGN